MRYTYSYKKLKKNEYTTIRRNSKGYKIGDIIMEIYPDGKHRAKIVDIKREALDNLSVDFLEADTDLSSRRKIYELFQSFYGKQINFKREKFYIYYLKKV